MPKTQQPCATSLFPANLVITDPVLAEPFLVEERRHYRSDPLAVLAPASVSDLVDAILICRKQGLRVVTQGGNTGLCGGAVANGAEREVLLSTRRLPAEIQIDPVDQTGVFGASVTLLEARAAAQARGLDLPISYGSEGTATIGGGIATNAGGMDAIRYGTTRHLVRGLEVVLADGSVLDLLTRPLKDNTGYDLRNLFIGSEGTLGIVTRARMQLVPLISKRQTAVISVASMEDALSALSRFRAILGQGLLRLECISRAGYDLTLEQFPEILAPIEDPSSWVLIVESGLPEEDLTDALYASVEALFEDGIAVDGTLSQSLSQATALWNIRERIIDAQTRDGASIKLDIAVPLATLPVFIDEAASIVEATVPGARPVPFGHLGDGNIHYNIQQCHGTCPHHFLDRRHKVTSDIHSLAVRLGGSFSAEHGIGRLKVDEMARLKSPVELSVMRSIKHALDPENLFNPGKVLPTVSRGF